MSFLLDLCNHKVITINQLPNALQVLRSITFFQQTQKGLMFQLKTFQCKIYGQGHCS